jgi:hypothetical protein
MNHDGHIATSAQSTMNAAAWRATGLADLPPEQVLGDDGPLQRFVTGLATWRKASQASQAEERLATLRAAIAAEQAEHAQARAAAARAGRAFDEATAAVEPLEAKMREATAAVVELRRERNAMSLRERGYVPAWLKQVLVVAVAIALLPLIYLSMDFMDSWLVQGMVAVGALCAILAVEHGFGFSLAHVAQHASPRMRHVGMAALGASIAGLLIVAEVMAGQARTDEANAKLAAPVFNAADAVSGAPAVPAEPVVSTMWTVPLGIAATLAGAIIVALYALGKPGTAVKERIAVAERELREATGALTAARGRRETLRAQLDACERAADEVTVRARRAEAELEVAGLAAEHVRAAGDADLVANIAAAEIQYWMERSERGEHANDRQREEQLEADQKAALTAKRQARRSLLLRAARVLGRAARSLVQVLARAGASRRERRSARRARRTARLERLWRALHRGATALAFRLLLAGASALLIIHVSHAWTLAGAGAAVVLAAVQRYAPERRSQAPVAPAAASSSGERRPVRFAAPFSTRDGLVVGPASAHPNNHHDNHGNALEVTK